jgi:choline dehydrogenase-like flavoprotein
MDRFDRISYVAALGRDTTSGRIRINKAGNPDVEYELNEGDRRREVEGVIAAARVLEAAGATEIYSPHPKPISYRPGPGAHEKWAEEFRRLGFAKDQTYFSFHQMGSCRMGVDPKRSAVDANNQTHEVRDLYVLDGSTFPTPSGVNPMVSIYGIAHRGATKLAQRLS